MRIPPARVSHAFHRSYADSADTHQNNLGLSFPYEDLRASAKKPIVFGCVVTKSTSREALSSQLDYQKSRSPSFHSMTARQCSSTSAVAYILISTLPGCGSGDCIQYLLS